MNPVPGSGPGAAASSEAAALGELEARTLALHRELVAIPSISHQEAEIADRISGILRDLGARVERVGDNVLAFAGKGPRLLYNSHFDTVPAGDRWTRDPWQPVVEDGKVYGLGSNDAKASVAAMIHAFTRVLAGDGPVELCLMLVPDEETGGKGTEIAWPWLLERGWIPEGVVVGEPTGLDVATAQKGMLVLELVVQGDSCHSANARSLGARNALRGMAHDLVALDGVDLGSAHPDLGSTTMEPTVASAGKARNQLPETARCFLDLRTVPGLGHDALIARLSGAVTQGELKVVSKRLEPSQTPPGATILEACRRARGEARFYGSATMSDLVWFRDIPSVKVGPGRTERSHTPDEFVLESEVLAGARFYSDLAGCFAEVSSTGGGELP